jgi:D-alanyl-D-alanine carboxypeptidase/D-alanyl-D-alanine-endopeptidase (penicillin-binding protein 4)
MRRLHHHSARALLAFILLLSLEVSAAPAKKVARKKSLAEQIKAVLSQPELSRAHWGIDVVDLDRGKIVYSLNADQLFIPASNTKLFTTAAALAWAGPEYRFRTTVETEGKIDSAGRLQGDLVIVGRGDPNISGRVMPYALKSERVPPHTQVLEELADQVAARGVKRVDGDVIGDDTFYAPERYAEGWAQDDLQWDDGAPVSALTFNDNVLFVNIQPGEHAGDKAVITIEPQTDYYDLDNRILTTAAGVPRKIGVHRDPGSKTVVLWGSVPEGDSGTKEPLAIEDPAEFTAQLFHEMLERRGINVSGKSRARHGDIAQFFDVQATPEPPGKQRPQCCMRAAQPSPTPALPKEAQPPGCCMPAETPTPAAEVTSATPPLVLAEHVSLPFIEDVRVINKTSQNLHAELALRLAGKLGGQGGSFEGGSAAVRQFLLAAGLKEEEFAFLDGSGLSRRDLVTPEAVTRLLMYVAHQPWGAAFEETLPAASVDGSLSERFLNSPAAGLIHAKTGTLGHVNALSGYGQTLRGKRFVFSIFCNNHNLSSSKVLPAIDSIVKLLVSE